MAGRGQDLYPMCLTCVAVGLCEPETNRFRDCRFVLLWQFVLVAQLHMESGSGEFDTFGRSRALAATAQLTRERGCLAVRRLRRYRPRFTGVPVPGLAVGPSPKDMGLGGRELRETKPRRECCD